MRRGISVSLRFKILQRDHFLCQYCGQRPPAVTLEIDHILPVVLGGSNAEDNLITSCHECNRGKRDRPLENHPVAKLIEATDDDDLSICDNLSLPEWTKEVREPWRGYPDPHPRHEQMMRAIDEAHFEVVLDELSKDTLLEDPVAYELAYHDSGLFRYFRMDRDHA